jgi:hypothetical protein
MTTLPLVRLDERLWSYQTKNYNSDPEVEIDEIRIALPHFKNGEVAYKIARIIATLLDEKKVNTRKQFLGQRGLHVFEIKEAPQEASGLFRIKLLRDEESLLWPLLQCTPFTRQFQDRKIATVTCESYSYSWVAQIARKIVSLWRELRSERQYGLSTIFHEPLCSAFSLDQHAKIDDIGFGDPFTRLATTAFQTSESNFSCSRKDPSTLQFILGVSGQLELVPILERRQAKQENQRIFQAYYNFVLAEYGLEFVQKLDTRYGITLQKAQEEGALLLPETIFWVNIAATRKTMEDVEKLYKKLFCLWTAIQDAGEVLQVNEATEEALLKSVLHAFTESEKRALMRQMKKSGFREASKENMTRFLDLVFKNRKIHDVENLECAPFQTLIEMMQPCLEERARAFTGRKITARAISQATNYEGDKKELYEFFELLHLFSEIEKMSDEKDFYELLASVIAKKEEPFGIAKIAQDMTSEGLLLPGVQKGGARIWYYLHAFMREKNGNGSMLLLPATHAYKAARLKVFTGKTLETNRKMDPEKRSQLDFEHETFVASSIPLWVGYLLQAQKLKAVSQEYTKEAIEALKKAKELFFEVASDEERIDNLLPDALLAFLLGRAEERKELEKFKQVQDVVFLGHSLGGSLAQVWTHHWFAQEKRIPLPHSSFHLYVTNSSGVDDECDERFMQFGRAHQQLFSSLHIQVHVHIQLEYGDFIISNGETYLGIAGYSEEDRTWLRVRAEVFSPLETARLKAITTLPIHERRKAGGELGQDFRITGVEPNQLYGCKHAWWLKHDFSKIFGYGDVINTKVIELVRKVVSAVIMPLRTLYDWIYEKISNEERGAEENKRFICASYDKEKFYSADALSRCRM